MSEIVSVSPFRCRMSSFHDRLEVYLTEESCRPEIESFERFGQLIPVLGRKIQNDPMHDVELVYGARRLFVARHLNKPLLVELKNISDKEGIIALDIENRHRKDISAYERGLSYAHWLREKHFSSQDELARTLKVSGSQVSRLLKIAKLPPVIINAFKTPADIHERWGLELYEAWQDPARREGVTRLARSLSGKKDRPLPSDVFKILMARKSMRRLVGGEANRDEVVLDQQGKPRFRIRYLQRSVTILLSSEDADLQMMQEVRVALLDVLRHAKPKKQEISRKDRHAVDGPTWAKESHAE